VMDFGAFQGSAFISESGKNMVMVKVHLFYSGAATTLTMKQSCNIEGLYNLCHHSCNVLKGSLGLSRSGIPSLKRPIISQQPGGDCV